MGAVMLLSVLLSSFCGQQILVVGLECGTRFNDFTSSAVLAEVVLQGSVTEFKPSPLTGNALSANVNVSNVFKGMDILKGTGRMSDQQQIVVESFGRENRDDCVAPDDDKFKHQDMVFFLRQSPDRRMMELSAFPLPVEGNEDQRIKRSLCNSCIQPPSIQRLNCKNCAREPTIKTMKSKKATMGRRARLRCIVRGKPAPTISWFKDNVPIMSGDGGVTIRTTALTSTLHFSRTTSAHGGRYKCVATNGLGNAEDYVTLEVSRKPRTNSRVRGAATSSVKDAADKVECQTNLCLNGGTCFFSASLNLRQCVCPSEYEGVRCENTQVVSTIHNDTNHRRTAATTSVPTTTITTTTTTTTTNSNNNNVLAKATKSSMSGRCQIVGGCLNRGTCLLNSELDTWYCHCPSGYYGSRCEHRQTSTQRAIEHQTIGIHSTSKPTPLTKLTTTTRLMNKPQTSNHVFPTRVPIVPHYSKPRPTSRYSSNGQRLPSYPVKKKSSLKIIFCRDKTYCLNKGKCRYIRKLDKKYCTCRSGYGGLRCERVLF